MSFRSATIAAASQTALKFGAGLGLLKILAVYLGPAGMATFGQVQSSFVLAAGVSAVFASNGLTSLLAAGKRHAEPEAAIIGTSLASTGVVALACALALPALNAAFGERLFGQPLPLWLIALISLGLLFQTANACITAVFTARGAMKTYGALTSVAPVMLLCFSAGLAPIAGFRGAAVSIGLSAIVAGAVALETGRRRLALPWRHLRLDRRVMLALARFGAFALVSLIAMPLSQIVLRDMLTTHLSADAAGTWHAAMRLSEASLAPVVTLFTIYLLPRQAAASPEVARETAWRVAGRVLPLAVAVATAMFIARRPIVVTLFSAKFLGMASFLQIQFAGDVVRVLSWVFAYTLIARGLALRLAALEAVNAMLWPLCCHWWVLQGDVAAASKSYLLVNTIYLALTAGLLHFSLAVQPAPANRPLDVPQDSPK
ncbi:MAG: hypothetical protein ACTHL8_13845 [Burkholderiaceae bacterium]